MADRPPQALRAHASASPPTGVDDKRAEQLRLEMVMFAQNAQHPGGDPHRHSDPPPERPPRGDYRGATVKGATGGGPVPALWSQERTIHSGGAPDGATGGGRHNAPAGSHTGNVGGSNGGYSSGNSGSVASRQGSGEAKPSWDARVKVSQLCLTRADCQTLFFFFFIALKPRVE